jgi:hypothetical protein
MIDIILSNFGFWFNFAIPVVGAAYLALTHKEYVWKEFGIQAGATFAYVMVVYALLFSTTTDLMDREYWNGQVTKFEYYEEWKEEVTYTETYECGTSKNPRTCTRTKTRIDYHSPYWQLKTSNGETISISRSEYRNASGKFGHREKDLYRSGQVSFGDGDMYYAIPDIVIPTSVSHIYTNYVTAAKQTVLKATVSEGTIDQLVKTGKLKPYPSQYEDRFGATKLYRIIDTTGKANTQSLLKQLNMFSAKYGRMKQVNPIIYITDQDRTFKAALEHYWKKAKKNDAVLILGVSGDKIAWSDVIAWTNNSDFIVDCGNGFDVFNIKDSDNIVKRFGDLIVKEYKRKPMEEFAYLKENITLEWYWQLAIFIGNVIMSFFIFRYFLSNYERKRIRY